MPLELILTIQGHFGSCRTNLGPLGDVLAVTCESLVSWEFSRIILQFQLSISISRHFYFTFTSRKEWNQKSFHFSFLEKSESISNFTLFSREKRVKLCTECETIGLCITLKYNIYDKYILQNLRIFSILENFSRILEKFHFSISISRHFHFTFHFSKRVNQIFISLFTSRKEWIRF